MGGPATATLPGVFASPGGLPIMVDGKVTGAVGVSGVTGDQDEQCSRAGLGGKSTLPLGRRLRRTRRHLSSRIASHE